MIVQPISVLGLRRMTIGIGLICKSGLVVAADSLTVDEAGTERFDLDKVSVILDRADLKCVIVRAGVTKLSGEALRVIEESLREKTPCSRDGLLELIRACCGKVVAHLRQSNPNLDYFSPFGRFSLLIGIFARKRPYLYVYTSQDNAIGEEIPNSAYVGSGHQLAHYLLSGVDVSRLTMEQAVYCALYVVEAVKLKHNECKGDTSLAFMDANNAIRPRQEIVNRLSAKCVEFEKGAEQRRVRHLAKEIKKFRKKESV